MTLAGQHGTPDVTSEITNEIAHRVVGGFVTGRAQVRSYPALAKSRTGARCSELLKSGSLPELPVSGLDPDPTVVSRGAARLSADQLRLRAE
jgi:hypothetical protein